MQNPFEGFQQGLMTGAQLGGRMREQSTARGIGSRMATGDYAGASQYAYGRGDLQSGSALGQRADQVRDSERQQGLVGALRTGDYDGALGFAQSFEELQQITEFRNSASEGALAQATRQAEQWATLGQVVRALPPEQRLARAQAIAGQFGVDPAAITPETLSDEALESFTVRAMGLKDYLSYQQDERAAQRPIIGNGFVSLPPGSQVGGGVGQPQTLDALPPGARIRPRPNPAPSAPAAGGAERNQTPRVSFQSSGEARQAVSQIVPGIRVTNADRTPADTARIRRQGYNPSDTSFHLQGQALDLTPPPGMSMGQLEAKMRQAGFRVLNEGHHIHISW